MLFHLVIRLTAYQVLDAYKSSDVFVVVPSLWTDAGWSKTSRDTLQKKNKIFQ